MSDTVKKARKSSKTKVAVVVNHCLFAPKRESGRFLDRLKDHLREKAILNMKVNGMKRRDIEIRVPKNNVHVQRTVVANNYYMPEAIRQHMNNVCAYYHSQNQKMMQAMSNIGGYVSVKQQEQMVTFVDQGTFTNRRQLEAFYRPNVIDDIVNKTIKSNPWDKKFRTILADRIMSRDELLNVCRQYSIMQDKYLVRVIYRAVTRGVIMRVNGGYTLT